MAFDWTHERIAAALSITPPTLRKNYFRELKAKAEARARVEGKLLSSLMAKAEAGDVTAIDKYFKRLERHDQAAAERIQVPGNQAAPMGKKAKRKQAADSVRGRYAPPPAPGTIN